MLVRIMEVSPGLPTVVRVVSAAGEMSGAWKGDERPIQGQAVHVELDLERDPTWGVDLHLAAGGVSEAGRGRLLGTLEEYDELVGMTLRVGEGLLHVTPKGEPPTETPVGATVVISSPQLSLWPYNL